MEDCGLVTAADLHAHRLRLVEQAARRLGLTSIETLLADGRRIGSAGLQPPHRILVDAPCSGLGVIRRLPELKWRRRPADLARLSCLQLELLGAAAALLRPGGLLLYSVCTFEPEETAAVADAFSAAHPRFRLEPLDFLLPPALREDGSAAPGGIFIYPHRHGMDGFFMALWRKD
jgi:16S rRNA (cytosine967-C5)-methyltransferase